MPFPVYRRLVRAFTIGRNMEYLKITGLKFINFIGNISVIK